MNSYLVETYDCTAPVCYEVLCHKQQCPSFFTEYEKHYFHIIVTSGSMVIASTNPAICKTYPSEDILNYYQSASYETLQAFGFGKYKYEPIKRVIEKDPTYVKWCIENVKGFYLNSYERKLLHEKLAEINTSVVKSLISTPVKFTFKQ